MHWYITLRPLVHVKKLFPISFIFIILFLGNQIYCKRAKSDDNFSSSTLLNLVQLCLGYDHSLWHSGFGNEQGTNHQATGIFFFQQCHKFGWSIISRVQCDPKSNAYREYSYCQKKYISLFRLNLPDNFHVLAAHNENHILVISISAVHFFSFQCERSVQNNLYVNCNFLIRQTCEIIYPGELNVDLTITIFQINIEYRYSFTFLVNHE